ncbi:MAG: diguanylate cyclase [Coriobacteriia bacterium]|nr:diguanylate cyclase [Coriobacteriia bacterium]
MIRPDDTEEARLAAPATAGFLLRAAFHARWAGMMPGENRAEEGAAESMPSPSETDHGGLVPPLSELPLPAWIADEQGRLSSANDEWLALAGPSDESGFPAALPPEDLQRLRSALRHTPPGDSATVELHVRGVEGRVRTFDCAIRGLSAQAGGGHIGVCYDVTEVRMQERRLSYMATHDALTGLANRWLFEEEVKRAIPRARRGMPGVVMLMDVDGFKAYNDTFGHLEGDQALVNLALLLQTQARASDVLARFGGDEFGVLLEGATVEEACEVAGRMRDVAAGEFVAGAREAGLGLSIGIIPVDGSADLEAVLREADVALYRAKERGRGGIVLA